MLYDLGSWSWDFKVEFFPLLSDIPIAPMCLIIGVGSISRFLIVLQKTNDVDSCEMPFLRNAI